MTMTVVLDGRTLNPGDLSWEPLGEFGHYEVYPQTTPDAVEERVGDAEIVLTNKAVVSADTIRRAPGIRYIGVTATGYNIVDVQAASEKGVVVCNVPAYGTDSVAQMVFAHLFNLARRVAYHSETVRNGRWSAGHDFCYWDFPQWELNGKVLGILGPGRIGAAAARIGAALGMKVIAYHPRPESRPAPESAEWVSLKQLFQTSDVVTLHCPLNDETHHIVNAERLSWMKPSAFLINTSRGPLVDEVALANALLSGSLAGAGLDVLETEPPPRNHPLFGIENCFITPHNAWSTREARKRLMQVTLQNIRAFLDGEPRNVVSTT